MKIPDWAQGLLNALELREEGKPHDVLERAGIVADRLAPDTRNMWKRILLFQGTAVLVPLLWFLATRLRLPVPYIAYTVALCTLLVVGIIWWLRWRGMQHTWTRARAIVEIARSSVATWGIADQATVAALAGAPSLQRIARWIVGQGATEQLPLEAEKKRYLQERIDDQLNYYRRKNLEAAAERRRLSQGVTAALDAALFLAVAGIAISFNPQAASWLQWSGSDYVLGAIGAALPLTAILLQLLGSYLELNRRAGRYSQQIEFLQAARETVIGHDSDEAFDATVLEVERCLLGEVVEWFYQAEHSEPYYRAKTPDVKLRQIHAILTEGERPFLRKITSGIGISAGFFARVLLGRVLVMGLSVVVTTALIAFRGAETDPSAQSDLRGVDGRLLSSYDGMPWNPDPWRAEKGFLLIAHGLRDGVKATNNKGEPHWMRAMQNELQRKLGSDAPDICLADWHEAAQPAGALHMTGDSALLSFIKTRVSPGDRHEWVMDIAAIRPQAETIGELVGYKLARALRRGDKSKDGGLRRDRPMHLIGHSAGGFVVLRAALVLYELRMAPEKLRVTMLDTPAPDWQDLRNLLEYCPIDYYCSSSFTAGLVPANGFHPNYTRFDIAPPADIDAYTGAHSYAYKWFILSIRPDDTNYPKGFGRSPFATGNQRQEENKGEPDP
jgi:hypothetical protein